MDLNLLMTVNDRNLPQTTSTLPMKARIYWLSEDEGYLAGSSPCPEEWKTTNTAFLRYNLYGINANEHDIMYCRYIDKEPEQRGVPGPKSSLCSSSMPKNA